MPQPVELTDLADPLVAEYRRAWERVTAELESLVNDPLQMRRKMRLVEMRRAIEAVMSGLDKQAAAWVASSLPHAYSLGGASAVAATPAAGSAAGGGAGSLLWSLIQEEAVEELAFNLFGDLLHATKNVNDSTKRLVNTIARDEALQKAIAGRTAKQAGREMERILQSKGVHAITYSNGAKHGLAEYSQMAIRTTTAKAYNTGALLSDPSVKYYEVFDGPQCGWESHNGSRALGRVVSRQQAMSHLISHPNCRRAFGPRPDLETEAEAEAATGSVTPGQTAAQEAQDAARGERQRRVANRRARARRAERKPLLPAQQAETARQAGRRAKTEIRDIRTGKLASPDYDHPPGHDQFMPPLEAAANSVADVPSVFTLIQKGYGAEDAATEHKRLVKNARNVERRARKKDGLTAGTSPSTPAAPGAPKTPKQLLVEADQAQVPKLGQLHLEPLALHSVKGGPGGPGVYGSTPWYSRMRQDHADYLPVVDLELVNTKYTVKSGLATRRDGISYLMETPDGAPITDAVRQSFEAHIAKIQGTLADVPASAKQYQKGFAILDGANPADAHWAKQYDNPGFKSAATGGQGGTNFWGSQHVQPGTIVHELGHNLDSMHPDAKLEMWLSQGAMRNSDGATWEAMGFGDADLHGSAFNTFTETRPGSHPITVKGFDSNAVTTYGASSAQEDFAESFRLYVKDRREKKLGYLAPEGGEALGTNVRFSDMWPERAVFFDKLLGTETDYETAFRLRQREKLRSLWEYEGESQADLDMYVLQMNHLTDSPSVPAHSYAVPDYVVVQEAAEMLNAARAVQAAKDAAKKAAEAAALAARPLTVKDLSFGDKTGIGVKAGNAKKQALKQGFTEAQAKQVFLEKKAQLTQELLDRLNRERGVAVVDPSALGSSRMRPDFLPATNAKAKRFVHPTQVQPQHGATTQGATAPQAKANIASDIGNRLNNEADWNIFREMKMQYGEDPGSWAGTTVAQRHVKLSAEASTRVQTWAVTSGDSDYNAVAMQMAIRDEFGVTGNPLAGDRGGSSSSYDNTYQPVAAFFRRFVRRMYETTQDELRKAGVTEVSVWRGMNLSSSVEWGKKGERRPKLMPANSWSTERNTATHLGSTMFSATVPADRILGCARTGFGCYNEYEYVIFDTDGLAAVDLR